MGRHRRAVEVIDTMLIARPRRIADNEQQDDVASLSNSSGGSHPQVDHPGDPPDGSRRGRSNCRIRLRCEPRWAGKEEE